MHDRGTTIELCWGGGHAEEQALLRRMMKDGEGLGGPMKELRSVRVDPPVEESSFFGKMIYSLGP